MDAHHVPVADPPESREPEELSSESRLLGDEQELTDEEAFYLAQEESFADMRARYQAWPRRKL